ncbi:hypothetical protein DZF98_03305, partial [Clavibacter californiensis]
MTATRRRSRLPLLLAPLTVAAALALAGCTGSPGGSATTPSADQPASIAPTATATPSPSASP